MNFSQTRLTDPSLIKNASRNDHDCQHQGFLILVPYHFKDNWQPMTGNFFYEIYASAIERYPHSEVRLFFVQENQENWIDQLVEVLKENPCLDIVTNSEKDPSSNFDWNFDLLLTQLSSFWKGIFYGILFDSVWEVFLIRNLYLATNFPNVRVIAIDRDIRCFFPRKLRTAGPTFLPISKLSLTQLGSAIVNSTSKYELSFLGKVYEYRRVILEGISLNHPKFHINPELVPSTQYSYLEYFQKLSSSRYSLNLARANAQDILQLKCRVLEAALAGSIVVTDEKKWISLFFNENEFVYFKSPQKLFEDIARYEGSYKDTSIKAGVQSRALELAPTHFWETLESVRY
jgi:hypothetical protein